MCEINASVRINYDDADDNSIKPTMHQLVLQKIDNPLLDFDTEEKINCLMDIMDMGVEQASCAAGLNGVLLLGMTGAGKSTTGNYVITV